MRVDAKGQTFHHFLSAPLFSFQQIEFPPAPFDTAKKYDRPHTDDPQKTDQSLLQFLNSNRETFILRVPGDFCKFLSLVFQFFNLIDFCVEKMAQLRSQSREERNQRNTM
ncbi:hypothetical protein L0222_23245 [bacterium]|nr:hypothetical protein [bacterium]